MAHDESGSIPESALSPATRALATGATANPSPNQRASAYALQIGLQSDPPGAWAGNVWEQYSKYRGIVSLAIRPYVHAMRAAKISVLRRKSNVRKSLGGSGHYSRDDEYEPVEADHPLAQIVEEPGGPNGAWGFGDELAFLALQRHITGVGYAWCPPNTDGKPVRFFALATGSVTPGAPPGSPEYPQGSYIVNPYMGWVSSTSLIAPTAPIPAEQVPAFKEFNPYSRTLALSTLATGAKEIDLLDAITDFRWTYFNKGAALDTFIQLPGADDDAVARFKEQFKQEHVGSRNARKVLVAGGAIGDGAGAAKIQQLAPNAKDLDFPSGFEQSLSIVLAFFNVPKILAGFGDTSNYATYHGELKRFYDIAITPFCRDLSAFLSKSLARAWSDYAGEYRIEVEPQIPADVEAERAAMQFGIGQGAITVNEWRKANGMKPVEGGDVPASIYQATLQQKMQPQPQPGAPGAPAAMGGTSAAPQDAPPSEEQGAISDAEQAPEGDAEQAANLPLAGDDSEQGVQDATLQAAFAALGMGGSGAGRDDEQPVMKAAAPVNKPGSARSPHRAEGEIWTTASGKRYTKKNGKIVPAPQQRTQKPASSQPVAQPQQGGTGAGEDRAALHAAILKVPGAKQLGFTEQKLAQMPADAVKELASKMGVQPTAAQKPKGGTAAAPKGNAEDFHGQILKKLGRGENAKTLGLNRDSLAKMHPDAVKTIAAQLGITPPEEHYAPHAATVPASTPTAKTTLQRAHEWSDAMAAKHAAKVAQHLGVPPATAQKILGKAIRQIAEHALKNGGRASGTLTVGGKQLKVGVGKPGEAAARAQQPAESGTSAAPSGDRQVHEMTAAESKAAGTKFFRTAGGSLYAMDAQGRTTRVKSDHSKYGHDKSDQGLKRTSAKTVFVPSKIASALSSAGLTAPDGKPPKSRVIIKDGKATLLTWNEKANNWGSAPSGRDIPFSDKPTPGSAPLELWDQRNDVPGHEAYGSMHSGSEITGDVPHDEGHAELTAAAKGKPGATRPAPLPGGTTAAPSRPAGVPLKPPTPEELGFGQDAPPRPEAQDRPGTAAGAPTPAEPDWEQIANSPNRNRGTGLKRPSLLRRLRDSKLGRLGSRALEAYKDAVDRGIIVAGTDEERADARERRAARRVAKAFDPWDVADELRDAGEYELAADLKDLLETDDLPTIRKALADLPELDAVRKGFDPNEARDESGKWTSGGGEKIGTGSTGDVYRIGDEVHKNAKGEEGKIYNKLAGARGIADGRQEGDKIVTPHFKNVLSVDTVPPNKRKSYGAIVAKNLPDIVSGLSALSAAGYDYNDPIQVGFGEGNRAHLFDFSAAQQTSPKDAAAENAYALARYLESFGVERHAKAISQAATVFLATHNDESREFDSEAPESQDAERILARMDGVKPTHVYYTFNAREVPSVAQTEPRDGVKVIMSDAPLSDEFRKQWEIHESVHSGGSVQKADPAGMNTLTASEGGFLVPEETKPKKKKRKVPVAALVAKAIAAPLPGDWSVPAPLPVQPVRVLEQQQAAPMPPAPPMVVNLPADQPAPMVVNLPADPTPVTVNVGAPQVAPVPVTVVMPQTAPQFTNGTVERAEDGSWLIRREFKGVDGAAVAPTVLKARRTAEGAWQVEQVAE